MELRLVATAAAVVVTSALVASPSRLPSGLFKEEPWGVLRRVNKLLGALDAFSCWSDQRN